jgi:hypothetical protein
LTLLIFYENYRGILSQYLPFSGLVSNKDMQIDQEVLKSIDETLTFVQGYYSAEEAAWTDYRALDNFQRKVIFDLSIRVIDALKAAEATLEWEHEDASDNSDAKDDPEIPYGFDSEVASSVTYLQKLAVNMTTSVKNPELAIESGDLSAARIAYEISRYEYEQIEVFAIFSATLTQTLMLVRTHSLEEKPMKHSGASTKSSVPFSEMVICKLHKPLSNSL